MKKLGLVLMMVFAVGMAIAQTTDNSANINQTSTTAGNWYSVTQLTGGGNSLAISQVANLSNVASVNQIGSNNKLFNAAGDAWANRTANVDLSNPVTQISINGYNYLEVNQQNDNNEVGLHQEANGYNSAKIGQKQNDNELAVYQGGMSIGNKATSNELIVEQTGDNYAHLSQGSSVNYANINQESSGNYLAGYGNSAVGTTGTSYQYASTGGSTLFLTQKGGSSNLVGIYQRTSAGAYASISQNGNNNELAVQQNTDFIKSGTIFSDQRGDDNLALLNQNPKSGKDAYADIKQFDGNNQLVGVDASGTILISCAKQIGGNLVSADIAIDLDQSGGNNTAGLYQEGTDYESASITQTGGSNFVAAYQFTTNGYNNLVVSQTGGDIDKSTGIQIGAGNNYGFISQ